jgi:hypothetical protein
MTRCAQRFGPNSVYEQYLRDWFGSKKMHKQNHTRIEAAFGDMVEFGSNSDLITSMKVEVGPKLG